MSDRSYAKAIDDLVAASIRPNRAHASVTELADLHDAAARLYDEPMPLTAARRLASAASEGRWVFLLTGVYDPVTLPYGETDGPPGVVSLARALDLGFRAKPVILCEEQIMESIELTCVAAGFLPVRRRDYAERKPHSVLLIPFPITDPESSSRRAEELVSEYEPTAVVAVERKGRNAKGRYHNALGQARTTEACLDYVVDAAAKRGLLTIGVGDGGNEIGMGNIRGDVERILKYGKKCQCDCGGGLAPVEKTDVLVVANTANLGAYAITACLAILQKKADLMHGRPMEEAFLRAVAEARCMDSGFISPSVDGTRYASAPIVELIRLTVEFAVP